MMMERVPAAVPVFARARKNGVTRMSMGDADIVEDHAQEAHGPSLANQILLERQRSAKKLWSKVCAPRAVYLTAVSAQAPLCFCRVCNFASACIPHSASGDATRHRVSAWPLAALFHVFKLAAEGCGQGV